MQPYKTHLSHFHIFNGLWEYVLVTPLLSDLLYFINQLSITQVCED